MARLLVLGLLLAASALRAAQAPSLHLLSRKSQDKRMQVDAKAMRIYRSGLQASAESIRLKGAWTSFLDYQLALDSLGRYYRGFRRLAGAERSASILLSYAAFLAQVRCALELIEAAGDDRGLEAALEKPVPELGLPKGAYSRLKRWALDPERFKEIDAFDAAYEEWGGEADSPLRDAVAEDSAYLRKRAKGEAEALKPKNALSIIEEAGAKALFPVRSGISEFMADAKMLETKWSLISPEQIREAGRLLKPGDILLARREWALSDIGLGGFWGRAALYMGTPKERRAYFGDPETKAWVASQGIGDGDFETLLSMKRPEAYALSRKPQGGKEPRVIDALGEGVSFALFERTADADSLAVLRPRLGKRAKAQALLRTFQYLGRPYDFDYDLRDDKALSCAELIVKAYGLKLAEEERLGRKSASANLIARRFAEEAGSPERQFDFVLFLDGQESDGTADDPGAAVFASSWRRPKWRLASPEPKK